MANSLFLWKVSYPQDDKYAASLEKKEALNIIAIA